MSYHEWGDGWEHWPDIDRAERYILENTRKWAGIQLDMKEKYGSLRYQGQTSIWWPSYRVYDLFKPFEPYLPYKLYNWLVWGFLGRRVRNCIFLLVVRSAAKKYPHITSEILDDLLGGYEGIPWFARGIIRTNPWKSL
jgi:hypothetical protein